MLRWGNGLRRLFAGAGKRPREVVGILPREGPDDADRESDRGLHHRVRLVDLSQDRNMFKKYVTVSKLLLVLK